MSTHALRHARTGRSRTLAWFGFSLVLFLARPSDAGAFCGFYVGKADGALTNGASQVVLVRDGNRTVIGMLNDYAGDLREFALVVPVPVVLEKSQIHVGDKRLFEHLDAYSAPRLVEYFDEDPCRIALEERAMPDAMRSLGYMDLAKSSKAASRLGVTIEAKYTVGEYDILILSAKESGGLETWLAQNGYRIPAGASRALQPYIRQGLKFFVAKVNLKEQARTGSAYLRPLQFAFESDRFMLPIRLGMLNARGTQDLVIYALTREGRVETTNYRTVMLPTGADLPEHVKDDFGRVTKALFERQTEREDRRAIFTEYVWNMGWCDPCAADPLSRDELRSLGVFWLDGEPGAGGPAFGGGALPVTLTRLHLRYAPDRFPEDLVFQVTGDRQNFQARYVLRHAWSGSPDSCPQARGYFDDLRRRREEEARTLADLTGWGIESIRARMDLKPAPRWWERIWN